MMRPRLVLAVLCLPPLICIAAPPAPSYHMIDNFSVPLPSSATVTSQVSREDPKLGLASAELVYRLEPSRDRNQAAIAFPQEARPIPGAGTLCLWVKGDATTNQMRLILRHAEISQHPQWGRQLNNQRELPLAPIALDGETWKEVRLPVQGIPPGRSVWLSEIVIQKNGTRDTGRILLDGLRLYPENGKAPSTASLRLEGPPARAFSTNVSVFLDVHHFGDEPLKVQSHITMHDHNENLVAERDFTVTVAPGDAREVELHLQPDNLATFLPPFHIKGDVFSPDLPQLTAGIDTPLVMGNSTLLFDDFGNVFGRWFTSGMPLDLDRGRGLFGEQQHAYAGTQTRAALSRVAIDRSQTAPEELPPGRYAMRVDFTGNAAVFNGIHRYLPGDAYRMGLWVHGDGGGAELKAIVLDFSAAGSTFYTWNRSMGVRPVCRLDFKGWRYCEIDLPGDGVGPRTPRGSSGAIDFPLDLSAFEIVPNKAATNGTVLIGPIFLATQQEVSESLAVQVAYDDPDHVYASGHSAWATVQNGALIASRKARLAWTLLDRHDEVIANGMELVDLKPVESRTVRIDLATQADRIAARIGPLRLQVTATDLAGAASAEEQLVISKPDSVALVADFESDRSYPRLKAAGMGPAPTEPDAVPRTTTTQKHAGSRSLALPWRAGASSFASIDPPLAGLPTSISLWVYGDGSGALFYPLIGSQPGVISGDEDCQWNLFLPRSRSGPLQNAVAVDWQGWKELTFLLPAVPGTWNEPSQIPAFVPTYPLGVHLAVVPPTNGAATGPAGTLYVDDITVQTQLEPAARLALTLNPLAASNVARPGSDISVTVANREQPGPRAAARKFAISGGLFDWHSQRVAGVDSRLELAPGESRGVVIAQGPPAGAYALNVTLTEGETVIGSLLDDVLVADLAPLLGAHWGDALTDAAALRRPLGDRFAFVEHDWDWAEFQPGNLQVETLLACAAAVGRLGMDPFVLLGYSTYWSASSGFEELLADQLSQRHSQDAGGRDAGHATDTFHVPARLDDWENYVYNLMRLAGRNVAGWMLWNTPDSQSSLGVPPEFFARMIAITDTWRRRYCPDKPLILGGLSRETALPYLADLAKAGALPHFTGVNLRLDAGVISPEDSRIPEYLGELALALDRGTNRKSVVVSDLDWAVEKPGAGLDAFDQSAYLARAALLLARQSATPTLMLQNPAATRLGFGLLHKTTLSAPPLTQQTPTFRFKPAWYGMALLRQFLQTTRNVTEIEVQDIVPGRTRCLLYERTEGGTGVAAIWRNNAEGAVSFAATGLDVAAAKDLFGGAAPTSNAWYGIGKLPTLFELKAPASAAREALALLQVGEAGRTPTWPQHVLAAFAPNAGKRNAYAQTGGREDVLQGHTLAGTYDARSCLVFTNGGTEHFEVRPPAGAGIVLRKRFLMDDVGQTAEVLVNGKPLGPWGLRHAGDRRLANGFREVCFVVDGREWAGAPVCSIDLRYAGPANTAGWTVLAYTGGDFPLSALGAVHSDSGVSQPRLARNVVGMPLDVGKQRYENGIGVFAPALLEYPLNKQFSRFTAEAGVASATEGKGSVAFEVYGDGKKLWSSPVMSGLDAPRAIDLSVQGVDRLRLVVTDAGDGNRFDAANWCQPVLTR